MSRLWIVLGSLIWLITIATSATMSFLAGQSLGRTVAEGFVLAFIGLAADGWKALGPIFISALFRARRLVASVICFVVWITTALFAITAAMGFVAQNRQAAISDRMHDQAAYAAAVESLRRNDQERKRIGETPSTQELKMQISTALAQPVDRGTVATISFDCSIDDRRTRASCAKIAELKSNLARAVRAEEITESNAALWSKLDTLKKSGISQDEDAQGTLVARLSGGRLNKNDVGIALVIIVVVMIELISAFATVIVSEYAGLVVRVSKSDTPASPVSIDVVREFLLECTEPSDQFVSRFDMLEAFSNWCNGKNYVGIHPRVFAESFEQICREDFSGGVILQDERYVGMHLIRSAG